MRVAIHITHEALYKIGGIGEVINGLCTTPSYLGFFDQTLLYGPLFEYIGSPSSRLGKDGIVYFSSKDHYDTKDYYSLFKPILETYNIHLVYGKRQIVSEYNSHRKTEVEVLLVDITQINKDLLNLQKYLFWENFGLASHRYEHDWDYEQYFRIGLPYFDLISLLYSEAQEFYHFSHEYMGIPSLLALELHRDFNHAKHKRIFYAHEVAPVRRLVENLPGHDITFYNILKRSQPQGIALECVFGSQEDWYRTPLVKLSQRFDRIFAVGDWVAKEFEFLSPSVDKNKIKVVYNALPLDHFSWEDKLRSRERIEKCFAYKNGFKPDVIITHVCRLVVSKGIWRDLELLTYLDNYFSKHNLRAIYILLSSLIAHGRPPQEVEKMVNAYDWPFEHKEGWPDLVGYEVDIYRLIQKFNVKAKAIKGIFINQFGFTKRKCGFYIPEDISTIDLRMASDIELGLSIYEPFGIAHIEVLPWGGLSIPSTSCGVYFFLEKNFAENFKPYFALDFISTGEDLSTESIFKITSEKREILEEKLIAEWAEEIFLKIPKTWEEREKIFLKMQENLYKLDWEYVVNHYFIPSLPTKHIFP
ncbi:MAG: hypothetical protein N3A56_03015 [Thermodesulfobacteriaceae bacterium]|nr:hypothetical protein [Thermodesulfobacteriaceae bacterium]